MSFAKRLAALALTVSCVISTLSFSSAAAESAIKAVDGCGVTVSAESDGTYIYGIPQKTTPDRAESLFESAVIITSENEWVSTGTTLTLYENGVSVEKAQIIVKGDANSDGLDANGYMYIYGGETYSVSCDGTYSGGSTGASITTSSTYITSNGSISSGGSNRPF